MIGKGNLIIYTSVYSASYWRKTNLYFWLNPLFFVSYGYARSLFYHVTTVGMKELGKEEEL